MNKIIKILGCLLVLLVLAAIILPMVVPMDKVKNVVLTKLQATTGRDISMGDISLKVFPTIALAVDDVKVSNPAWAGGGNMADIKTLKLGVELMPLLHGIVHVKNFTLETPVIALIKDGTNANWQFNARNQSAEAPPASEQTESAEKEIEIPDNVTIKDGSVTFLNKGTGAKQYAADVNLDFKADVSKKVVLKLKATVNGKKVETDLTLSDPLALIRGKGSDAVLKLVYDTQKLDWKGALALDNGKPLVNGTIDIPSINVAAIASQSAPQGESNAAAAPAHKQPGHWSDDPIDVSGLNSAHLDLTVKMGELVLKQTTLKDIELKIRLVKGALALSTNEIAAYGGSIKLTLNANSAHEVSVSGDIKQVQAEPMLKDFAGYDRLSGTLESGFSLSSAGASERALVSHLDGKGNFSLKNGQWHGHNILAMARNVGSAFGVGDGEQNTTTFSECDGSFTARDGIISNKDLVLALSQLRVAGEGTANLPGWQVNYLLSPKVVVDGSSKDSMGISVPVRVEGALDSPRYFPDLQAALKQNLANPAAIENTVKSLGSQLKNGGLGNLLR